LKRNYVCSSSTLRGTRRRVPNIWAPTARTPSRFKLVRCGQLEQPLEVPDGFNAHDELLQLFALILANNIAAECGEFYPNFIFGHWVARITFWNIDPGGVRLAVVRGDGHAARLKFREKRFELVIRNHFHFVHDRNQSFVEDAL